MACTATYNTSDEENGAYGIYNKFVAFIENASGSTTNLSFRIRVTDGDGNTYTKDIVANGDNNAIIEPLIQLRDTYFKSDYTGAIESTNAEGWNDVQIEVGEISGTPPVFQGYDTDDTFRFYNGYEKDKASNLNYRIPEWYNTSPYLLPKTKKNIYLYSGDVELLSIPNPLKLSTGVFNASELAIVFKDSAGSTLSTSTVDLTTRSPALSGTGYWNFNINQNSTLYDGITSYAEVVVTWDSGETTVDSETLTLYPLDCQPKYDHYRLRWINRYGGEEFENFSMRATESIQITRGKRILSDGNDYSSTTFAGILNVNNPQLDEFGLSYNRQYSLRSNWFTQEQLDSLEEAFTSPANLMFTPDYDGLSGDGLFPVNMLDSNYEIKDIKQGLKNVELRLEIANIQPNQLR